ncbi:helix-turn-helix domain-containing protein [Streptomyces sp. WMMC500]|uniref:helix-turn-helix domain-containing protein n=1 Tax=Streptomyces sp. WMMC500 TaxID=3015154 RepID=UPI00248BD3D7|nr:helix-turn-helix domain-containing protein [Streptomyces sp. WMMC500]WBB61604.1 helix-turn-helix domain-containing protein [Streptomyces sp. WMMC500]
MKGLLVRLSSLDADAAAAVRVIAHFQALLSGGAVAPEVLVRSTAALAGCPAGLERGGADGGVVRFGPDGARPGPGASGVSGPSGVVSGRRPVAPAGSVWLERDGGPGPLDELVLEWMALAAGMSPPPPAPPHVADPALVETVLSEREAVEDRVRALRLLGLGPERPLRVVAVAGGRDTDAGVAAVALLARGVPGATVRIAAMDALAAVLVQPAEEGGAGAAAELARDLSLAAAERVRARGRGPAGAGNGGRAAPGAGTEAAPVRECGARFGVGGEAPPVRAHLSWAQARTALRFAGAGGAGETVVDHDALGPLALLADVPAERLRADPGVRALAELAARDGGGSAVAALDAFCRTGSLRRAAAELHLHHSSVAARLARAEEALGGRLREPDDRLRARLALYAWRLATASGE